MGHPAEPVRFWRRRLRVLDIEAGNDADMRVGRVHDGLCGAGKIAFCPLGHLADIAFDFAPDDPLDSSRKPEGLLLLEKKASDLGVLILFDGDKEGSPTPVTSGSDKVMFGIK